MKRLLLIIVVICAFAACNKETNYPEVQSTSKQEYVIASSRVEAQTSDPCTGTTFTMEAFVVKQSAESEWTPFFSTIKGFEYTEGTEYTIEVEKKRLYDPRMSVQYWDEYSLLTIKSQEQKESDNLPSTFVP